MECFELEVPRSIRKSRFNWNKILVMFSLNWISFSYGYIHGQIAGMIGSLQSGEDGILLTDGQLSLIAAFIHFTSMIGIFCLAILGEKLGRRWCYIICSLPALVNWIILYHAMDFTGIITSRFLAGLSIGALSILNTGVTAEFNTQKTRAINLSVVTILSPGLGVTLGHVLGVLFHWRSLALLGISMTAIQIFLPYFWVESPHWLAMKGRFEDCEVAFRKLHGNDTDIEYELVQMVKMETNKQKAANEANSKQNLKKLLMAFKKKYFWGLILMSTFLYTFYAAAGKVAFNNLATVILQDITGASNVLLFTIIVDAFILCGTLISCIFIKKITIRVLLFSSGLTAIVVLLVLSACLYFRNGEVYFQWINVTLLALYFIIVHAGPYPVIEILLGEMFPLELKLYCFFLTSPVIVCTMFLCVLLMPYLVSVMGYHGLFMLNSFAMLLCLAYLYVRLPETKGKTLQEIEVYFKTKNYDIDEVLNNNEQINSLI